HARESGPWSGLIAFWAGCDTTLLVAGAWDCPNQRAPARHRFSAGPNELPVLLEPSGRRAGVSLHERNRLEPAPFEHPEDPGPNRAPRHACGWGPRETILCTVRRSLVPDGDRPDQMGADVRCRAGSGSNRRNLHVEVYHSFRKSGTA